MAPPPRPGIAKPDQPAQGPSEQEVPQEQAEANDEDHEGGDDGKGLDGDGEDGDGDPEDDHQHDEPQPFDPEAEEETGDGPEFQRMPKLMKQMLFQFDRNLGFKDFSKFCDEITDNLRTYISKPSRQSFARKFTKARRSKPTLMEMELARTCHGGYIPEPAKKFVTNLQWFQKWIDLEEENIPTKNERPQPKRKNRSGSQKARKKESGKTGTVAVKKQPRTKTGPKTAKTDQKKKRSYGVANPGCNKEAKSNKKNKKDGDSDEGPGSAVAQLVPVNTDYDCEL